MSGQWNVLHLAVSEPHMCDNAESKTRNIEVVTDDFQLHRHRAIRSADRA